MTAASYRADVLLAAEFLSTQEKCLTLHLPVFVYLPPLALVPLVATTCSPRSIVD